MGRGLLALLASTTMAFSSFGAGNGDKPEKLHDFLILNDLDNAHRKYSLTNGYTFTVSALKQDSLLVNLTNQTKNLEYKIIGQKNNPYILINDFGADGLTPKDTLVMTNNINDKYKLVLRVSYPKKYKIKVYGEIYKGEKIISKATKDPSDVPNILWIRDLIVEPKIERMFERGNSIYFDAIEEIMSDTPPESFPSTQISEALKRLDNGLEGVSEKDMAKKGLDILYKELSKNLKQLVKEKEEKESKESKFASK